MQALFEAIQALFGGIGIGLYAFWNALGLKEAIEAAYHQILAAGLGVPVAVVSIASTVITIGRLVIKRVF